MKDHYQLYGMPASLYMAKVRSYLIKQQIPFVERAVGDPYYSQAIQPAVGRMIMPVLETPGGDIVQDGADIIDFFEARSLASLPAIPTTAVHQAIAYLFELFGGEGLLRPAMHYRWNFDDINLDFIKSEFCAAIVPGSDAETCDQVFEFSSGRMRKATVGFGVTEESIGLIEQSYAEFLSLFSEHLSHAPYLLGGRPTLGDYGLVAPLYAHLGRDPYPCLMMKQIAPKVARWVERMNAPQQVAVEYGTLSEALFENDAVPVTLKNLMSYVAREYLPEIQAHVAFANQWLDDHPGIEPGTNGLRKPSDRAIGAAEFNWRGITLKTTVMPYRFYLLQRLQDSVAGASAAEQESITALFTDTGLGSLLELKTHRRVERHHHLEVWGADLSGGVM